MNLSIKQLCILRMSGMEDYKYIMDNYKNVDLTDANSDDTKILRKKYKAYYRVRRDDEWCNTYFEIFEKYKQNNTVDFDTIIEDIFNSTDSKVEASFSSKMLATINPNMPILDSRVLANLNLKIPDYLKGEKKKEKAKEVYGVIKNRYAEYCRTPESDDVVKIFEELFPKYTEFSKAKKIDYFLWILPRDELEKTELFEKILNE